MHFDISSATQTTKNSTIEHLFSDAKVDEVYTMLALQSDIAMIKQISDKESEIKTFDYDGVKYDKKNCEDLISELEKELVALNENIKSNDIEIFNYFKSLEQQADGKLSLENLYQNFFNNDSEFDGKYELYTQLSNELYFINYTTPIEQIKSNFSKVEVLEKQLKKEISEILKNPDYETGITPEIKENFELYLSNPWQYFGNDKYLDENLEILFSAMNNYAFLLSRGFFLTKQKLLSYQEELLSI